jgi:hypothetical protein
MGKTTFKNSKITTVGLIVVATVSIVLLGIALIWIGFSMEILGESEITLLVTGLGSVGTFVLAVVTVLSVRANMRSVSELEKERERPIVKDEIVKVIQPAIDALNANTEHLESETGIDWIYTQSVYYNPSETSDRASSVFAEPAPIAMVRFQQNKPDLWSKLEDHQELLKQLIDLGDETQQKAETPIRVCTEELDWKIPESDEDVDVRVLVSAVIKDLEQFGEASEYYEFWQKHGDEIKLLVEGLADEELEQLESIEARWATLCEKLSDELFGYKIELQQEYGISESTVDEELEEWPTRM